MTTSVKVTAHCAIDKQVRISRRIVDGLNAPDVVIRDGETHEQVVYDDFVVSVKEELRPVLTEADALADLAGTPRPPCD